MKTVKIMLKIFGILLAAVLILAAAALLFMDRLAKDAVQNIMPVVTGVSCTIDHVSVSPFSAQITIDDLILGNAPGYASEYSIALGNVTLVLDPATLFSRKTVIEEIRVKDVTINCETSLDLKTDNVLEVIKNLNRSAEEVRRMREEEQTQGKALPVSRKLLLQLRRFQLNKLVFQDIRLWIMLKGSTTRTPLDVTLPDMGPLGIGGDGLTPLELLNEAATAAYDRIHTFATKSIAQIIVNFFKSSESAK